MKQIEFRWWFANCSVLSKPKEIRILSLHPVEILTKISSPASLIKSSMLAG